MRVKSDDAIWRAPVVLEGPLEIESTAEAWVASAGAGIVTAPFVFWFVYGASAPNVGGGWAFASAAIAAVIAAAGAAIIAGTTAAALITPDTPASYRLRVIVAEFRAPQSHRGGAPRRQRMPHPPEQPAVSRRAAVTPPAHFDKENPCVRPECLAADESRAARAAQP